MRPIFLAAAFGLLVGLACASGGPDPDAEQAPPATSAELDGELCEHGVLEAVCTKHHPALIPVFQAKGDWCEEHGFAMSFCPIHHPERGGRPLADVSSDGAPADGLKIRFKTRETAAQAGIQTAPATIAADEGGVEATAHLTWDATRLAVVGARSAGVVQRIQADVGTAVKAGDPLAVVQSPTAAADRSAADAARSRVELAEQALQRKRGLEGVVSQADLARAEQELTAARAELQGAQASVGYTLTAPIAGVVTRRDVTVGASVDAGTSMFEIVDPSRLWAEIDVPETEVGYVRSGQTASITLDGLEDRVLTGTIDYLAPSIDPDTRTTLARVALDNADGALRANMYGTARIAVGGDRDVLVVPSTAVQRAKSVDVVFVKLGVDEYETRRVRVVRRQGDVAHLAKGVKAGEEVVTEGSFLLKTEILKDSIGAGCCDVE
jgi:cobalt-zinc-cadmium efflux system membrane fusion protein